MTGTNEIKLCKSVKVVFNNGSVMLSDKLANPPFKVPPPPEEKDF
jgi:hypothetical protein